MPLQKMTFPGYVRTAPPPRGEKPLRVVLEHDEKTGKFLRSIVTVPPGRRLVHERKPGPTPTAKPTFLVSVAPKPASQAVEAELEHTPEHVLSMENAVRDEKGKIVTPATFFAKAPDGGDVTGEGPSREHAIAHLKEQLAKDGKSLTPASVTATSVADPTIAGRGATAAEAVANLNAAVATKAAAVKAQAEAEAAKLAAEAAKKSGQKPSAPGTGDASKPSTSAAGDASATQGAPVTDPEKKNPLVTREG